MVKTVLVAGTASHVGKSTVATGLCRLLARVGVNVIPYKAQNMSNNARVALRPDGGWGEIGVSQFVQAQAAGVPPTTDMNPILLKPRGAGESQLVINGQAVTDVGTEEYYQTYWSQARTAAIDAYDRLTTRADVIIAEGAGSIAEINLIDRDLANIETASFADADIVLVTDIERGGAFASLYGTVELLPDDLRSRIVGLIINKFRGEEALLTAGVETIENRLGIPVLGTLPFEDPGLPAEDSLSLPADEGTVEFLGAGQDPEEPTVTIGVPRLPHIANFNDVEPLAREPGVRVAVIPLDRSLALADAVVLPGSKNTVDDLLALKKAGFDAAIRAFDGPIVGICAGYQMLGQRLTHTHLESTENPGTVTGIGMLPVVTRFEAEKRVKRITRDIDGVGPLTGASGSVTGYEIHQGRTELMGSVSSPLEDGSAANEQCFGTYLHGLFENQQVRRAFVSNIYRSIGVSPPAESVTTRSPFDKTADLLDAHLELSRLGITASG